MESWMRSITVLRNECAHHGRIYDSVLPVSPKETSKHKHHFKTRQINGRKFYARAIVLYDLLRVISPESLWNHRLKALLEKYPDIPLQRMGFPDNWTDYPFWQLS
jgi:abortive infection bacteriophage resistance protein